MPNSEANAEIGHNFALLGPGLARVPPATRRHQESRLRGRHPDSRAAAAGVLCIPGREGPGLSPGLPARDLTDKLSGFCALRGP